MANNFSGKIIEIDGGYLGGGGQILRTASALSAITRKPCRIFNIRESRPNPGLALQHLLGLRALAQLCQGRLEGDKIGSKEIRFFPQKITAQNLNLKIETAGSITLILQTLIPPGLFTGKPVKIAFEGGATDTFFSPTFDYFRYAFLKILEKLGVKIDVNILRRGFYPEGGASVVAEIQPLSARGLKVLNLTQRGQLKKILAISGASESLKIKKVAERQIIGIREILGKLKLPLEEKAEYYQTSSPGSQVCLIAEFENTIIGVDNLGRLGKRAEDIGKEAALKLLNEQRVNGCLDRHMADQILPYLALSGERSSVTVSEITNHCETNIWVIEKFLKGEFQIENNLVSWIPKTERSKFGVYPVRG